MNSQKPGQTLVSFGNECNSRSEIDGNTCSYCARRLALSVGLKVDNVFKGTIVKRDARDNIKLRSFLDTARERKFDISDVLIPEVISALHAYSDNAGKRVAQTLLG